jgi:hypothetical protein
MSADIVPKENANAREKDADGRRRLDLFDSLRGLHHPMCCLDR